MTGDCAAADGQSDGRVGGQSGDSAGGTYTLVVELAEPATVEMGALGPVEFDAGWCAYTGSAQGPGGFARVDRHHEVAAGERDVRHWHVDYLLGHHTTSIEAVVRTRGADVECAVSDALVGEHAPAADAPERVPGFGASDCDCESHLAYAPDREALLSAVRRAHDRQDPATD